jgi:hypothetical protein
MKEGVLEELRREKESGRKQERGRRELEERVEELSSGMEEGERELRGQQKINKNLQKKISEL